MLRRLGIVVALSCVPACGSPPPLGTTAQTMADAGEGSMSSTDASAGAPAVAQCEGGASYFYVVRWFGSFERPVDETMPFIAHGFDLDGMVSDGTLPADCGVRDLSAGDRVGIDNTIGGAFGEDFMPRFEDSIEKGAAVMLVRLSGVDDLHNDPCVDVTWFEGALPPGTTAPLLDDQRRLLPGQPFVVGNPGDPQFKRASIVEGRLDANGQAKVIPIARGIQVDGKSGSSPFPISEPRIAFDISDALLGHGDLGGRMSRLDLNTAYTMAFGKFIETQLPLLVAPADLAAGNVPCALLSAGFGFDAVKIVPADQ